MAACAAMTEVGTTCHPGTMSRSIDGRARVVRTVAVSRRDGSPGTVAAYGLEFVDLAPAEQDRLVGTILWRKATSTHH